jgi:hypothetical protein
MFGKFTFIKIDNIETIAVSYLIYFEDVQYIFKHII